jgi:hypothetical protein
VRAWHPRVTGLELGRRFTGYRCGWRYDALEEVERVEKESGVDWVREREGHGGRRCRVNPNPCDYGAGLAA